MRSLPALLLALALAACANPGVDPAPPPADAPAEAPPGEPVAAPDFDGPAWLAAVEAAPDDAALVALSETLLDALDWRTACGEDDPTSPRRGIVEVHHLGDGLDIAGVTCETFAYQSVFAIVSIPPDAAPRLVRARLVGEDGQPSENTSESFLGLLSAGAVPGTFEVFTKSAGHGGCGTDARYALQPDGSATVVQVRANDCTAPVSPDEWPVTFSAE